MVSLTMPVVRLDAHTTKQLGLPSQRGNVERLEHRATESWGGTEGKQVKLCSLH